MIPTLDSSIILNYFPDLTEVQSRQINQLGKLYANWNEKINVISRKDMDALWERHVLHSLAIAKVLSFEPGTKILDVGTGGGFPGIPLAILFPDSSFHLVDSVGKKIKVVNAVATELGLVNVTAEHGRMELLKGSYDFVVSRAVARTKQLVKWTGHLISKDEKNALTNGWILLKGGDLKEEVKETKKKYSIYDLSNYFDMEFFDTKKLVHLY